MLFVVPEEASVIRLDIRVAGSNCEADESDDEEAPGSNNSVASCACSAASLSDTISVGEAF